MSFNDYLTDGFYDELFESTGAPRPCAAPLVERINSLSYDDLLRRQQSAEASLMNMGITFTVYGSEAGTERIFPFDIIPRVVPAADWQPIAAGLAQRITALNLFIDDLYHDQKIIRDGVIPADMIRSAATFRPECAGLNPPRGIWIHITGSDLVRDTDGRFYVLEDNLRCPSGVSYVLENRDLVVIDDFVMMRTTRGFRRVDVVYRRIDDDFIDPLVFRPDSMLGVPGIMQAYRKGNVALANAPGTGATSHIDYHIRIDESM
jgi:uncharacterized circularly permuted ATP-grasp superfamily protein